MMNKILIAHRGNISGPNPDRENGPDYILEAINQGYEVEIDVQLIDNKFYLGHDKPQYLIERSFLIDNKAKLWIHCKNAAALCDLVDETNVFFHDYDNCVLTSKLFIWTYPGKTLTKKSVAVLPERFKGWDLTECCGICSDFVSKYK